MPELREKFKEHATSIFENDIEQRQQACTFLNWYTHFWSADGFKKATERLRRNQSLPRNFWTLLNSAIILITLVIVGYFAWNLNQERKVLGAFGLSVGGGFNDEWKAAFDNHSAEERLLLFGDESATSESKQWEALWNSDPQNPAYYGKYASAYSSEHNHFPSDFIEKGDQLDQGNSWYRLMLAGQLAEKALVRKKTRGRSRGKSSPPQWVVKNAKDHSDALQLMYEGASMPKYDTHKKTMLEKRVPLLPVGDGVLKQIIPSAYLANDLVLETQLLYLARLISVEAQRCAKENDIEGLKKLIIAWESIEKKCSHECVYLIEILIAYGWLNNTVPNLKKAAETCGMEKEAQRFTLLEKRLEQEKKERDKRKINASEAFAKSGVFVSTSGMGGYVNDSSKINFKASRMADYAFARKILFSAGAHIFLVLSLILFGYCSIKRRLIKKLSCKLRDLFSLRDWLYVILLGIALPFLIYWIFIKLTPWHGSHYTINLGEFFQPWLQIACLGLMLITSSSLTMEWRLSKIEKSLGSWTSLWLWGGLLASVVALLLIGIDYTPNARIRNELMPAFTLLSLSAIFIFAYVLTNFLKQKLKLKDVILSRVMIPVFVLISFVMAAHAIVFQIEERYWIKKDTIFKPNIEQLSFNQLEYIATKDSIERLRKIMER